jgi:zinc D-Ala-D-Ala dipeptidase
MAYRYNHIKVIKGFYILPIAGLVFFTHIAHITAAQQKNTAKLVVIKRYGNYRRQVKNDSQLKMVNLASAVPGLQTDLRYGTRNNFTGATLYKQSTVTFMRKPAAAALLKVQQALQEKGLGLKVFDAYRPYAATVKMWELIHDDRYVANPANGSGHNRGLSVDLTIFNSQTGTELDMGTGFDNFTDTAHHSFTALPETVLQNRLLLKTLMEQNGFRALSTEWWHYSWPNDGRYAVMNIDFKKFKKRKP